MGSCAARCAVLCVLALGLLSACGANDGQGAADRPSVTASVTASSPTLAPPSPTRASPSPTRALPSPTRSAEAPEQTQTQSESPRPSRSLTLSPDTTEPAPTAPSTREPEPTSQAADDAYLDGDRCAGPVRDIGGSVALVVALVVALPCW